jgi:hypothetical protein
MRSILIAVLLLVPAFASARSTPFVPSPGRYSYQHEYELLSKKRYESVYAFTEAGAARLEDLRSQNYECTATPRQIYLCTTFEETAGHEREILSRVAAKLQGATLEFAAARGAPEFVRKGTWVTEWRVPQAVKFHGKQYDDYRFLIGQGVSRIFLGTEKAEETFLVSDQDELVYPLDLPVSESREIYRMYFGLAKFSRK